MSPPRKVGAGGNLHRQAVSGPRCQARQNVPDEPVVIESRTQGLFHFHFNKPILNLKHL
jgi:hypothetical protein